MATQPGQPESIDALNGYQLTCNAFTHHSNDIKNRNTPRSQMELVQNL